MRKTGKSRASWSSRRWLVSGAAAGAIVAVGGGLLVANGQSADRQTEVSGAARPLVPPGSASSPSAAPVMGPVRSGAPTTRVAMPPMHAVTKLPQNAEERLAAAKRAGADDIKPQWPLIRPESQGADVRVVEKGSVQKGGKMLRIVSAHADLTGYGELAWVADKGAPYGDARCSQNFRLSNEQVGKARPTLMICWRTSQKRSVYTVSVNVNGRPSKRASVAAIDKTWHTLA